MPQINTEGNSCDICHIKTPEKLEKVGIFWCCPGCAEKQRKKNQ